MKPPPLSCVHAVKQKASLAKSGLTSLATAAGGMYCVSTCECACVPVCLRLCVRVFVSVKMRWPDCSAEQWGKTQPRVVRIAPIKTHKRRTTMHPCCQPPPSQNPSVFGARAMLPLLAMHTLTLALLTMPKQIWRWKMIHHWLCTALSALSYREAKSFLKSLYPYCCKDRASYNWTSSLLSLIRVGAGQSNAAFLSDSIKNIHMEHILLFFVKVDQRTFYSLMWRFFTQPEKRGWQSVKPAMKRVSCCLKELLTHFSELNFGLFV